MVLQRGNGEFFGPISGLNFGRWILGGEFLEGEFFWGPLLLEKTESKNSTREFGSKIRASEIRFPEFGPKSGSGGAKSPVRTFVPDKLLVISNRGYQKSQQFTPKTAVPKRAIWVQPLYIKRARIALLTPSNCYFPPDKDHPINSQKNIPGNLG